MSNVGAKKGKRDLASKDHEVMALFCTVDNTFDEVLLLSPQILGDAPVTVHNVELVNLSDIRSAPTFQRSLRVHG
jgi:hypothetical protein